MWRPDQLPPDLRLPEHPEAAARDDFDFPARLAPEFPAPLKDDMVVEDLEDDYPLENHMDELHGPLVVND